MTKKYTSHTVNIVGAPFADGQNIRGVELAPKAIRQGNLVSVIEELGWKCDDLGDLVDGLTQPNVQGVTVTASGAADKHGKKFAPGEDPYVHNVNNSLQCGHKNTLLFNTARKVLSNNNFLLTLGGDHAIASATIAAALVEYPNLHVIWVDAHGDCNTPETSPSGHYHGMPVAHLMKWFKKNIAGFDYMDNVPQLKEENLFYIGLRDLDLPEKEMLKNSAVTCYTMFEVDKLGIGEIMNRILTTIKSRNAPIFLSFDIDGCDPTIAPGTGTKARGGLSYRESHYICESIAATQTLVGMDLVEVNPSLDLADEEMHGDDNRVHTTQTVRLAIELISSSLGKRILSSDK